MSFKDNQNKKGGNTASAPKADPASVKTSAPAAEAVVKEEPAKPSTDLAKDGAAAPAPAAAAPVVPTVPPAPVVAKTRLFWQKSCHSLKESTNTEIKAGEVFVKTSHTVNIENPDAAARTTTPVISAIVYSLKRGKRIYYTPYVTPEQAAAAEVLANTKATEKAEKEKAKADEKAKKEAEKAAKAGNQGAAVAPTAAPAAAEPAPAAEPAA